MPPNLPLINRSNPWRCVDGERIFFTTVPVEPAVLSSSFTMSSECFDCFVRFFDSFVMENPQKKEYSISVTRIPTKIEVDEWIVCMLPTAK